MADISAPALGKALAKVKQLVPTASASTTLCDVSKEAQVQAMIESLDSAGGLDVIFNNAGIMHAKDDDAVGTPEAIWDLTMDINVKGVWFGSKHAVLAFRKHKKTKGSVINTASVVALVGSATPQLAYTASKGAVLALTRELAMVHAREGFRFNSLCPAPLNTPLLQDWLGDDQPKRLRREIHFPSGRFGEAIEQAQAVVFLASDEASFVNGHVSFLFFVSIIIMISNLVIARKDVWKLTDGVFNFIGHGCGWWNDQGICDTRGTRPCCPCQQRPQGLTGCIRWIVGVTQDS